MKPYLPIEIHAQRLADNVRFLDDFFSERAMTWTFVIKAFERVTPDVFAQLSGVPCASVASARPDLLLAYREFHPHVETWWLNYEAKPCTYDWVNVNLTHMPTTGKDCPMVLLDELREGCDPEVAHRLIDQKNCTHVGAYLNCAELPAVPFLDRWKRLGYGPQLKQSLGTSVSFHQVDQMQAAGANHYRIGELAITGRDLLTQKPIPGMRQDAITPSESRTFLFN